MRECWEVAQQSFKESNDWISQEEYDEVCEERDVLTYKCNDLEIDVDRLELIKEDLENDLKEAEEKIERLEETKNELRNR